MGLLTFWSRCPKVMAVRTNGRRNPADGMGSRIKLDNRNEAHGNAEWSRQTSFTLHDTPEPGLVHRPNDQGWIMPAQPHQHIADGRRQRCTVIPIGIFGKMRCALQAPLLGVDRWRCYTTLYCAEGGTVHFYSRQLS